MSDCADASQNIIGYVHPLVVSPGERVGVHVSCHQLSYTSRLVRLGPGHNDADAPPPAHQPVEGVHPSAHLGRSQFSRPGSFATVPWFFTSSAAERDPEPILEVTFWAQPFLPQNAGHEQYFFSTLDPDGSSGFGAYIASDGNLTVIVGGQHGRQTATMSVSWTTHVTISTTQQHAVTLANVFALASSEPLTIASHSSKERVSHVPIKSTTFNGKIDSFKLDYLTDTEDHRRTLLQFDFSKDIPSEEFCDVSGSGVQGHVVNCPARGVTGHDWDASETAWNHASYGYGAIHFHDDDVDDAAWDVDFELTLPSTLQSGCYGIEIDDGKSHDMIPFFVRPDLDQKPTNKVAFIFPTFTYTAYANDRMYDITRDVHIDIPGSDSVRRSRHTHVLESRPDLGVSLYDSHNDGSGTTHSSLKRVVLNMRPDYFHWGFGGPRELPADLWFIGFLDRELGSGNYDVLTDHDLSRFGTSLLLRYDVLLSGSHPEYPTYAMLDAYDAFLAAGRFFMYLGGNGYYWVTGHSADPKRTHRIEVRRADQGCRVFSFPPGNWFLALTGEQRGLWRSRGRTPNRICGLGSDACGMGQGAPYGVTPEARQDPKLQFMFKGCGLEDTDIIGDFGLVQGAASGDEIDRLDYSLGTPENAVIVATSKLAGGHSDNYGLFNEEIMFPMVNTLGTTSDKVRSDLVYYDTGSGGAVFGVGSINWVGSLAWKNYENNIAQITANVLHEFIEKSLLRHV